MKLTYRRLFKWKWDWSDQKTELETLLARMQSGAPLTKAEMRRANKLAREEARYL